MFTAQGCVLEGSPRYRGGTVVQFAQVQLVNNNNFRCMRCIILDPLKMHAEIYCAHCMP